MTEHPPGDGDAGFDWDLRRPSVHDLKRRHARAHLTHERSKLPASEVRDGRVKRRVAKRRAEFHKLSSESRDVKEFRVRGELHARIGSNLRADAGRWPGRNGCQGERLAGGPRAPEARVLTRRHRPVVARGPRAMAGRRLWQ